nr:MAG TPA: hypothetical protein [Caudoviricetes sp.]DAT90627.1 MAG TPA: hypothetical protein [Caudoviricetes sp.]DAV93422.1 MAG TPA: hypothetical protein [Caudoviricetes sp.]DAX25425.1 MAG TPA: hypothetical protein [Caudoviricetes sp.]
MDNKHILIHQSVHVLIFDSKVPDFFLCCVICIQLTWVKGLCNGWFLPVGIGISKNINFGFCLPVVFG